jgi:hypothetical protein
MAGLFDGEYLVRGNIMKHLADAAWPTDFNILDYLVAGQAEVDTTVARGRVAHSGRYFVPLLKPIFSGYVNLRSDSHAIAFGADQFQKDPVIAVVGNVAKKLDLPIEHGDYGIDVSIVEQVAKCNAAVGRYELEIGAGGAAYFNKFPFAQVTEQNRKCHCPILTSG